MSEADLRAPSPPQYTVTASASPIAGGTVAGGGTYVAGSTVTLVATASSGYRFIDWTSGGVGVSADATYIFVLNSNVVLAANFGVVGYIWLTDMDDNILWVLSKAVECIREPRGVEGETMAAGAMVILSSHKIAVKEGVDDVYSLLSLAG